MESRAIVVVKAIALSIDYGEAAKSGSETEF